MIGIVMSLTEVIRKKGLVWKIILET